MRFVCRVRRGGHGRRSNAKAQNKRDQNLFHDFFSIVRAPQGSLLYVIAYKGRNRGGRAINLIVRTAFLRFRNSLGSFSVKCEIDLCFRERPCARF